MRIPQVLRSLASGAVLYVVMAACGASDGVVASMRDGGDGLDAEKIVDAMLDELGNPVKDAKADPPDVATEPCNKMGTLGGVTAATFAVHSYPGKTVEELALVRVIAHVINGTSATIGADVYEHTTTPINVTVRAGSVAVYCGAQSGPSYDSAAFILPR